MAAGRAGQPPVVGEMIAGVLLGPSLLGEIAPRLEAGLFPKPLLPVIYVAGQLGLVALMFQAGRELRSYLRPGLGRTASTISGLGVTVPLMAGAGLALAADGHVAIFMPGVRVWVTAAFVGVTLAITAFPMLARIIIERGLSGTRFGTLALACGGIDDMAAWILLAGVLSLASAKLWPVTKALAGAVVLVAVLALVIRPLLDRYLYRAGLSPQTGLLVTTVLVLAAAWFTTDIGLYAVFGAFSIGLVMPPQPREKDEDPVRAGAARNAARRRPRLSGGHLGSWARSQADERQPRADAYPHADVRQASQSRPGQPRREAGCRAPRPPTVRCGRRTRAVPPRG
jgi:Kef-type K+ transport system membrane component KefB